MSSPPPPLTRLHRARLQQLWRSAGWPSHDALELDLLAAGLVTRETGPDQRETLRLTDTGIAWLAEQRQKGRRAESPHDRLAGRVAAMLMASGRIVWRELSLRAVADAPSEPAPGPIDPLFGDPVAEAARATWRVARPDVFSVRHTTVEAYLHPIVHEIKVSRADLLSDLRHAAKRQSYQWLCSEVHYVFPAGIAEPQEIPEAFGVWLLHGDVATGRLELARPARHVACTLPFPVWMALARAPPPRAPADGPPAPRGGPGA
ncbi:MAG: hypothetical protein ABW067_01635, partial [Rhizobacter sp.]